MAQAAIELIGINKSFGAVRANRDINLEVARGTIHGIVGENGAGKSTLMSILYGFYQADSGEIRVSGKPVSISTPNDAIALGIGMVHQHFMLVDNFTVLENVILGAENDALLKSSIAKARSELERLEREYGLEVDPDAVIEELPVGLQQRVEILKALYRGAEILILDEPTGVLTPAEADHLFRILKQLKEQGKTVVLITHKLREIMAITDTVSVMRQGTMVATRVTKETTVGELAELMVGRRVLLRVEKGQSEAGAPKLSVKNLTVKDQRGVTMVDDVSFDVRGGEIVGIAGLLGCQREAVVRAIFGATSIDRGEIRVRGRKVQLRSPRDAIAFGIGFMPADRKREGLVLPMSVGDNIGMTILRRLGRLGFMKRRERNATANSLVRTLAIKTNGLSQLASQLSGGNQQKIVIGKWIARGGDVVIAEDPTRGVDVGAKFEIWRAIQDLAEQGKAILLLTTELQEMMDACDRILVMSRGRVTGHFHRKDFSAEAIAHCFVA
ncbi:MAG: ABC transporter ATP-binding protein [Mesorhizobium sp.]|nr:MAG: ABC transporter ATP-binding protein [Mesorhizobium sp.]